MRIVEKKGKIYEWKCPKCGKTIGSLYPKQLKTLIASHKAKHERIQVEEK